MLNECLDAFKNLDIHTFFDGTLGAGGHAEAFLSNHEEIKHYFGCDQDLSALSIAKERLKKWENKLHTFHSNFSNLEMILQDKGPVDGFFLTWGSRLCS